MQSKLAPALCDGTMDQILLIFLALLPFAVGILARLTERSWVSPAALFALVWGGVALPAAVAFADVPGLTVALVWIFVATSTVLLGTLGARYATPWGDSTRLDRDTVREQFPGLRQIVLVTAIAGVGEIILMFGRQGFSFSNALSFTVIAQVTAANRADYLTSVIDQGLLERFLLLFMYSGTLFGGMLFRLARSRREAVLSCVPLALVLIVFALYASRMGALYGGSFWIAAYLATTILVGTWQDVLGWRFLFRIGLVALVLGFTIPVLTMVWRYSFGWRALDWRMMLGDGFSFVAAFGLWFKDHVAQGSDFLWGGRALRRLVAPLGIHHPLALEIEVGFTSSNVFTVLRDLIEDFGTVGSLLVLFMYGFVGRLAFTRTAGGRLQTIGILALVYAFALTSVAFSIFSYTVTSFAMIGFIVYCLVAPSLPRELGVLRPSVVPSSQDT